MRKIESLKWARLLDERPEYIPETKVRGVKAKGLKYERAFAKEVGGIHGTWFEFEDSNGHGVCQTDIILEDVVFECKLSWTWDAIKQLIWLYLPVTERAFGRKMTGVVVTNNVKGIGVWPVTGDLEQAVKWSRKGLQVPVLHWLGVPAQLRRAA